MCYTAKHHYRRIHSHPCRRGYFHYPAPDARTDQGWPHWRRGTRRNILEGFFTILTPSTPGLRRRLQPRRHFLRSGVVWTRTGNAEQVIPSATLHALFCYLLTSSPSPEQGEAGFNEFMGAIGEDTRDWWTEKVLTVLFTLFPVTPLPSLLPEHSRLRPHPSSYPSTAPPAPGPSAKASRRQTGICSSSPPSRARSVRASHPP